MPGQILIAFVAKLRLYGFWRGEGLFAELLRILEKDGATGWGGWQRALRMVGIGGAERIGIGAGTYLGAVGGVGLFLLGLLGLVFVEPAFEDGDGGAEVVAEDDEQVDVVEVFLAAEAVGEVVAWVDGGPHFAAAWAQEAEVGFADFGGRPSRPRALMVTGMGSSLRRRRSRSAAIMVFSEVGEVSEVDGFVSLPRTAVRSRRRPGRASSNRPKAASSGFSFLADLAVSSGLHQQPGPRGALPEEAAQTRKGIVTAASEEFRKNGIVATGLNDLMSAAGLTHGGFYKHFASKDQLVAEACAEAVKTILETLAATASEKGAAAAAYLSTDHRDNPATGCPLSAIGSELARSDEKTRAAADLLPLAFLVAGLYPLSASRSSRLYSRFRSMLDQGARWPGCRQ